MIRERESAMATITGTNKNDVLDAEDGVTEFGDLLLGRQGKDKLFGLEGDDFLNGGQGKDQLTGGEGADTFVFTKGSGKDTIMDFEVGLDVIQIAKGGLKGIKSPEDILKHAKQLKNGDLEINLGKGTKIVLKGVDKDDLKDNPEDHFQIV
jgi:Ca2+-binding RTX toxin-like protein